MEYISPRSRRDLEFHERHGEISTISATSRQSRRVLGNLGEMEHISPRSRRDLESNKNHGEISARSLQSRRDLINLDEISPISARSRRSRRDLGKNFARVTSDTSTPGGCALAIRSTSINNHRNQQNQGVHYGLNHLFNH